MTYMLLIVEPTEQRQTRTEAEGRELYDRMLKFGEGLKSIGFPFWRINRDQTIS